MPIAQDDVSAALHVLGVREVVKLFRAVEGLNDWEDFVNGQENWPEREILGMRTTPEDAGSYYEADKYLSFTQDQHVTLTSSS